MSRITPDLARPDLPDLLALRHQLHSWPELGFQEARTSDLLAGRLSALGLEVHRGIGGTGIVALLRNGAGPVIAARSDMDALPMEEASELPFRSQNPGVFHGCGHDGHMATLIGAAGLLARTRDFRGTAMFVFQPAEEGLGGSRAMIADGLFERFPCDEIYALHNAPHHPEGQVCIRHGAAMAGADFFDISLRGRGGHAALPASTIDPVAALGQLIQALQAVVSRNVDPLQAAVLSITRVLAGDAYNVIPETAQLAGTIRTLDDELRVFIRQRMRDICEGVARSTGVDIEISFRDVFTGLINHPAQTEAVIACATEVFGSGKVDPDVAPFMASEDFADMLRKVPGAYFFLGTKDGPALHNPAYQFDDDALLPGAVMLARLIENRIGALSGQG